MSTHHITINGTGTVVVVTPSPARVGLNDTVIWDLSPATATTTITFRYPTHVRMARATGTTAQPPQGTILSKPGENESLIYDLVVTDPTWPASKPAMAELIIAVEGNEHDTSSAA